MQLNLMQYDKKMRNMDIYIHIYLFYDIRNNTPVSEVSNTYYFLVNSKKFFARAVMAENIQQYSALTACNPFGMIHLKG